MISLGVLGQLLNVSNISTTRNVSGGSSFVFVQSNAANNGAVSSATVTQSFLSPVGANDLIVVFLNSLSGVTVTSVADTLGNSYTSVINGVNGLSWNGGGTLSWCYYCSKSLAGSLNSVTASFSAPNTFNSMVIAEYSGVSNTNPLDASGSITGSVNEPITLISPTITTIQNGELVVGMFGVINGATVSGSGWTGRNQNIVATYEDAIQSTSGQISASALASGGGAGDPYMSMIVSFKHA